SVFESLFVSRVVLAAVEVVVSAEACSFEGSAVVSLSAWLSAAERPADCVKLVSTFRVLSSAITICFFTETSVCGGPKRLVVAERWDDYFHHVRENPLTHLELSSSKRQRMA